jgi:hypothetical protein
MIKELFLSCALALPATVHYVGKDSFTTRQFVEEYRSLKVFLDRFFPGGEFIMMAKRLHGVPEGYTLMPFQWRGHRIYRRAA